MLIRLEAALVVHPSVHPSIASNVALVVRARGVRVVVQGVVLAQQILAVIIAVWRTHDRVDVVA